jgi:hypothetical protein
MVMFLLLIISLLPQSALCSEVQSFQKYNRQGFQDLSIQEALRGLEHLKNLPLDQTPKFPTKEDNELARQKKQTPTLKGSTEKVDLK